LPPDGPLSASRIQRCSRPLLRVAREVTQPLSLRVCSLARPRAPNNDPDTRWARHVGWARRPRGDAAVDGTSSARGHPRCRSQRRSDHPQPWSGGLLFYTSEASWTREKGPKPRPYGPDYSNFYRAESLSVLRASRGVILDPLATGANHLRPEFDARRGFGRVVRPDLAVSGRLAAM
jgi:hypothetical protein